MNATAEHRLEIAASTSAPAELTDAEWILADRIGDALEAAGADGLTPSKAARKAGTDTLTAGRVLRYLVRHSEAHTSGNGCWTHYHAGRGW